MKCRRYLPSPTPHLNYNYNGKKRQEHNGDKQGQTKGEQMADKEQRRARVMINKVGGNASKNAVGYKVSIPSVWASALQLTPESRGIIMTFDGEKIIIEKANN